MKLKFLISGLLAAVVILMPALAGAASQFNPLNPACQGSAAKGPVCTQNKSQQGSSVNPVLDKIHVAIDIIAVVTAVASVGIIVYSGFMFATAGGAIGGQRAGDNPNRARLARATLTSGLVGLIITALAWTIVTFVSDRIIKS